MYYDDLIVFEDVFGNERLVADYLAEGRYTCDELSVEWDSIDDLLTWCQKNGYVIINRFY